jgi:hypothetical protein
MNMSIKEHEGKKYLRLIHAAVPGDPPIWIDVYAVLVAFGVTCPAQQHAIKKLLACGQRGKGNALDDLQGVLAAVSRAVEIEKQRTTQGAT